MLYSLFVRVALLAVVLLTMNQTSSAQQPATSPAVYHEDVLPPLIKWDGKSRALAVAKDDPWITPCEKSDFRISPSYDETMAWLKKLVEASPKTLKMVSLGRSPQGRDIWMIVASKEGAFTPDSLRASNKPTFLAQAGIHSGEIDGKDAGMMLLRDMTVRGNKADLLERANFLLVPIFSVDGHERASRFNRSNQRGPQITGWRTTSRNLNLNRDYAKLDSPEMRAMVRALDAWQPDMYFDIHVTDGADYQYDITWGTNGQQGWSPASSAWIEKQLTPALEKLLKEWGHIPGPLVFPADPIDLSKGIREMMAEARYSHGYGDARHIPSVLVENHALKPYDQRVLGTYLLYEGVMRAVGEKGAALRAAIEEDRSRRPKKIPLDFAAADGSHESIDFLGIEYRVAPSEITGGLRVEWLGKPITMRIAYIRSNKITQQVDRPRAYWIPPAWSEVIERLKIHGIKMEEMSEPREIEVTMYRLNAPKLADAPFEGHMTVKATPVAEKRKEVFPPGSVRVPMDQPLGELAAVLLEPASPDSFFQWGFFHEVLQRTEYIDGYIMEPMAERMMEADPTLREQFIEKLKDPAFASSPSKRLEFFYEKTPYFDSRWRVYPVAREE